MRLFSLVLISNTKGAYTSPIRPITAILEFHWLQVFLRSRSQMYDTRFHSRLWQCDLLISNPGAIVCDAESRPWMTGVSSFNKASSATSPQDFIFCVTPTNVKYVSFGLWNHSHSCIERWPSYIIGNFLPRLLARRGPTANSILNVQHAITILDAPRKMSPHFSQHWFLSTTAKNCSVHSRLSLL